MVSYLCSLVFLWGRLKLEMTYVAILIMSLLYHIFCGTLTPSVGSSAETAHSMEIPA